MLIILTILFLLIFDVTIMTVRYVLHNKNAKVICAASHYGLWCMSRAHGVYSRCLVFVCKDDVDGAWA